MHFYFLLHLGTPPSTEEPKGPYPVLVTPDSNPEVKVPVVQAFAYGKYLGHLKVEFDDKGKVTSWSGSPILLNNSVAKDPAVDQMVQQMKLEVDKVAQVRTAVFDSLTCYRPSGSSPFESECVQLYMQQNG